MFYRCSTISTIALACAALGASGCSKDLTVSNQDARIVLVGDLSEAAGVCGLSKTASQALTTDTGVFADSGALDAGAPGADVGLVDVGEAVDIGLYEDAGEPSGDAGSIDAGGAPSDAGAEVDAGDPGAAVDAGDPGAAVDAGDPGAAVDAGSPGDAGVPDTPSDAGSWDSDVATGGEDAHNDAGTSGPSTPADPLPSGRAELERDGDMLAIPYLIMDREADAQSIKVEICLSDGDELTDCGVAVAGPGGAGASGISTTPAGQCVLHVFNWDVGCGRFVGVEDQGAKPTRASVDVADEIVARISVVDSKESPGQSAPFTLKALGFDALPHCE